MRIIGVDFTSRPGKSKPIACACCELRARSLHLSALTTVNDFVAFETLLDSPGPWLMAVDAPLSLPREFVRAMRWGERWQDYVARATHMERSEFRDCVQRFKQHRPSGQKDLKRLIDQRAGAVSPLNVTRPPVGLMFYELTKRLLPRPISVIPVRTKSQHTRSVLEAYPALVARQWLGREAYKDGRAEQLRPRRKLRAQLLHTMMSPAAAKYYGLEISIEEKFIAAMITDTQGDLLDAMLCAIQGAWAWQHLSGAFPRVCEGWIADPSMV
ncbi:MAG: DUF429 domain-containing protein [Pseudomonadota bacterium]